MAFPLRNINKKDDGQDPKKAGGIVPGAASGAGNSSSAASGGLGFGSGGYSGLGGAAQIAGPSGSVGSGGWAALTNSISSATGLSAAAASKAGILGAVLAVSSGVAAFSFFMGNSTPTGAPSAKRRVFALQEQSPQNTAELAATASQASQNSGGASSLEYTPKIEANLREADPIVDGPASVNTPPSQEEIAAATEKIVDAPMAKKTKTRVDPGPKPKFSKKAGVTARSSGQSTKAVLKPMDGLAGSAGSNFQEIYKNGAPGSFDHKGQKRPRYGANRTKVALNTGSRAMDQAKFAGQMSRSGARMGRTTGASHTASTPFDGANAAARSLGKAQGTGLGETGLAGSANSSLGQKVIDPPPPPEDIKKGEDKTPYQGMLFAAMGALGLGTILLMAAGKLISQGRSNPTPAGAAMVSQGKGLAMAAMGAGGAAAGLGAMIAGEHGQMTQAIPFITGGGILAMQAGMVLAKADQAGEEASSGIENAAGQAAQTAGQALQGMQQQNDQGKTEDDKKEEPQPINRTVNYSDNLPGSTTGSAPNV